MMDSLSLWSPVIPASLLSQSELVCVSWFTVPDNSPDSNNRQRWHLGVVKRIGPDYLEAFHVKHQTGCGIWSDSQVPCMMMLLGKGWILDGKLISTDDCLVSCGAHCSVCRCMHCLWLTPAGKDWCNSNFLQVRSVSSSVIIPNITHTVTPSHHLSASQRFIQMTGPNSWLCPLHCNILRKRNKPDPDVQSYISPAFSGIFLK